MQAHGGRRVATNTTKSRYQGIGGVGGYPQNTTNIEVSGCVILQYKGIEVCYCSGEKWGPVINFGRRVENGSDNFCILAEKYPLSPLIPTSTMPSAGDLSFELA